MTQMNNCVLFSKYAGNRLDIWKMIEKEEVTHTTFGRGVITGIDPTEHSDTLYMCIHFENDSKPERKFTTDSFSKSEFFSNVNLPESLSDLISTKYGRRHLTGEKILEESRKRQQATNDIQEICSQRKFE